MNAKRRKLIAAIAETLENLEGQITTLAEEEQEALDNLPESFQDGERGDTMQECISELESVASEIEEIRDRLMEL